MGNVLSFPQNQHLDIEVITLFNGEKFHVVKVLDKKDISVSLFLHTKEITQVTDYKDCLDLGYYAFQTIEQARKFHKQIEHMSAIDLMILQTQSNKQEC